MESLIRMGEEKSPLMGNYTEGVQLGENITRYVRDLVLEGTWKEQAPDST